MDWGGGVVGWGSGVEDDEEDLAWRQSGQSGHLPWHGTGVEGGVSIAPIFPELRETGSPSVAQS